MPAHYANADRVKKTLNILTILNVTLLLCKIYIYINNKMNGDTVSEIKILASTQDRK